MSADTWTMCTNTVMQCDGNRLQWSVMCCGDTVRTTSTQSLICQKELITTDFWSTASGDVTQKRLVFESVYLAADNISCCVRLSLLPLSRQYLTVDSAIIRDVRLCCHHRRHVHTVSETSGQESTVYFCMTLTECRHDGAFVMSQTSFLSAETTVSIDHRCCGSWKPGGGQLMESSTSKELTSLADCQVHTTSVWVKDVVTPCHDAVSLSHQPCVIELAVQCWQALVARVLEWWDAWQNKATRSMWAEHCQTGHRAGGAVWTSQFHHEVIAGLNIPSALILIWLKW